jgi:hypothetical protein
MRLDFLLKAREVAAGQHVAQPPMVIAEIGAVVFAANLLAEYDEDMPRQRLP